MTQLQISSDLALPDDVVTSTLIVYGGKGMGKTNLLSVLLEEMSDAGLRWCAIDPIGVLWGLRHAANGKDPGVECLILGGVHGDIDIEPTGGAVVADLVADEDVDVIIDCSRDRNGQMWSVGQRTKFVTEFPQRLFQRQGSLIDGRRRPPRFVALDEAARYIPQNIPSGNKELPLCVGAWEQLVEEGRNVGIGVGLFTQRSARINKSVAELADLMLAFRTTGPNSINAIIDWLGEHVPKADQRTMVEQVRKLPVGTALAVSPGWLQHEGVVKLRPRRTFDSSATPRAGEAPRRVSGRGAVVDLESYRERMAETIERADASDPKILRKRIAELERELRERPDAEPERVEVPVEVRVEVPVLMPEIVEQIEAALSPAAALLGEAQETLAKHRMWAEQQLAKPRADRATQLQRTSGPQKSTRQTPVTGRPTGHSTRRSAQSTSAPRASGSQSRPAGDGTITKPQQKVLDAFAWLEAVGFHEPTKIQVGFIAGYRVGKNVGGTFGNLLGQLRSEGLIDYPTAGRAALTAAGRAVAHMPDIEPTTDGLQAAVHARLTDPESRVLTGIIDAYPDAITKQDAGAIAGYTVGANVGGTFGNILGRLRTLGLIDYPQPGYVVALPVLFLETA